MASVRRSNGIRWLVGTAGVAVLAVGFIGFLHLPAARPLLATLGVSCPVGHATMAQVEASRSVALGELRGQAPAAARPALGLSLDATTEAQAVAWAEARHLDCSAKEKGLKYLKCEKVPAEALGQPYTALPVDELTLAFGSKGVLVGVQTYRAQVPPQEAEKLMAGERQSLRETLKAEPTKEVGDRSGAYLAAGPMHMAVIDYRFSDYIAQVQATNLLHSGIVVTEKFLSAAN